MARSNDRVHVVHCIGSLAIGGAERQLAELINRLPPERFRQHLVLLQHGGPLLAEIDVTRCEIIGLGPPRPSQPVPRRRLRAARKTAYRMITLVRFLRRARPDVVHAQLDLANIVGFYAARLASRPAVATSQLNLCRDPDARSRRQRVLNRVHRSASSVFANSQAIVDELVRYQGVDPARIRRIHNGVDLGRFHPRSSLEEAVSRRRLGFAPGERVIACVANLHPYKGHVDLVRAFALLDPEANGLTLMLVGHDAGAEPATRQAAADLGVADSIRLMGEVHDVAELLSFSEFVVHPSHEEGLPNAILEAMAMGKAVVATDVGGIGEAVTDGRTGLLVPPRDAAALGEAMQALLRDPARTARMGRAGSDRAEQDFGIDRMIHEFESFYEDLAHARRAH